MHTLRGVAFLSAVCLSTAGSHGSKVHQTWLYTEVDGRGPNNWKDLEQKCGGWQQSPVNIASPQPDTSLKRLQFNYHTARSFGVEHTVSSVKFTPHEDYNGENYFVDPNLGNKKFKLAQLHFHSPSEHSLGGKLYDLEVHLVHLAAPAEEQPATASKDHDVAVVGVLFSASDFAKDNVVLDVFDDLPSHPSPDMEFYTNKTLELEVNKKVRNMNFYFGDLVLTSGYFTYSGSFTTPPCTEGVRWYVMSDVGSISSTQLNMFRDAMLFDKEEAKAKEMGWVPYPGQSIGNNRPTMSLNGRTVRQFSGYQPCELVECPRGQVCGVSETGSEYCVVKEYEKAVMCGQGRCLACGDGMCDAGDMCLQEFKRDQRVPYFGTPACFRSPVDPILPPPHSGCVNKTMANGAAWYINIQRYGFTCGTFEGEHKAYFCDQYGDVQPSYDESLYQPDARTGKEACCGCQETSPVADACNKEHNAVFEATGYGAAYTCEKFFQQTKDDPVTGGVFYHNCVAFGDLRAQINGHTYTANEACCACRMQQRTR